jgi:hypothetical protein
VRQKAANLKNNIMKLFLVSCLWITSGTSGQNIVKDDIINFWNAYDKIVTTQDSVMQYRYLRELYIDKATPGLQSLIRVRNYSDKEFVDAIRKYPKFWASIRPKTLDTDEPSREISSDIALLKKLYPAMKPAVIYYAIGAFRTNGTSEGDRILLGAELALADNSTVIEELPAWRQTFYKDYNPRQNIGLLCTHEYIHTQQKELIHNLLSKCLYEGVAEFVACTATGKKSNSPAIAFGKANEQAIEEQFVKDLYLMSNDYNWLWGENRNSFGVRDLGYYVGYEICERYYNLSDDKSKAIQELIELDFTDEAEVERIVNKTQFLPKTLSALYDDYEKERPVIVSVQPFANGSKKVRPGTTAITVTFSEPLNGYHTSIDYGPLGDAAFPVIKAERMWSADKKTWTFTADLQPNRRYQILISNNFQKENGVRLKPYLIDFTTE